MTQISTSNPGFDFLLVFFVYGLAFFSLGLAIALESKRSPMFAEGRVLVPLAAFGLLHGTHEWMEMFIQVGARYQGSIPPVITWARLILLVVSFSALLLFGFRSLRSQDRGLPFKSGYGLMGLLAIYAILVVVTSLVQHGSPTLLVIHADALARYLLAVPGALLAALALGRQAQRVRLEGHRQITLGLLMAAWSFALYGLTQVIVPPVDLFPASYLNSAAFTAWTGVPIQVVRAVLAVTATVGILRSIQAAEDERHHELAAAQQARLEALERVQQELEARESLRRELLRHIVIAQEEERSRIARELHDETAQFLTALMLDLATLRNSLPADRAITEIIERLQSLSRRMSQGIYRMVRDLRPAQLDDLGLAAALQHLVDQVRQRDGLEVRMSIEGPRRRLDLLVETALFRVAQEALTNVSRHAACQLAWLELHYHENEVTLCVRDDGKGFDPRQEILPPRGWGIAGMRERVESIGGSFRVHAAPGEGAQVEAIVPLKGQWSVEQEVGSDEPDPVNVGR